jgi:hypothetical protein
MSLDSYPRVSSDSPISGHNPALRETFLHFALDTLRCAAAVLTVAKLRGRLHNCARKAIRTGDVFAWGCAVGVSAFRVVLIKPSHYDADGSPSCLRG